MNEIIKREDYVPDIKVLNEVINENIGRPLTLGDLEQWKIPSGGSLSFQSCYDQEEKELEGIILFKRREKRYYEKGQDDEDGSPIPGCQSKDGKQGIGDPGMLCGECPHNAFVNGRKKCQDRITVVFLRKGDMLPSYISLPVMSIKPFEHFITRMTSKGKFCKNLIVKMSLTKEKSKSNIVYSRFKIELISEISGHLEAIKALQISEV